MRRLAPAGSVTHSVRLSVWALVCMLTLAGAFPVVCQEADGGFRAKVSAYTTDGRFIADQILTCPGSPACSFDFEIPFDGGQWSLTVLIKQGWPGTLNAWVVGGPLGAWGPPGGYREFRVDTEGAVELIAHSIDHRLAAGSAGDSMPIAVFRIQVV